MVSSGGLPQTGHKIRDKIGPRYALKSPQILSLFKLKVRKSANSQQARVR